MLARNRTLSRDGEVEKSSALDEAAMPGEEISNENLNYRRIGSVAVVDSRVLTRECLCQSLKSCEIGLKIVPVDSMEDWRTNEQKHPSLDAILLNMGDKHLTHEKVEQIREVVSAFDPVPVLLLADCEDLEQIVLALECGVRGYVPSSVGIAVCAEAIRLAIVGGCYVPSSSIVAMRDHVERKARDARPLSSMFTQRQAQVVEALRKGKANKIIAYELDMRESTVKVHIRNIMKKVKATNRTEVAYRINEMFPEISRRP